MSFSSVMFIYTEINIFCIALLVMMEVRLYVSINLTAAQRAMRFSVWGLIIVLGWDGVWAILRARLILHRALAENIMRSGYYVLLIWAAFFWFLFDQRFMRTPDGTEDAAEQDGEEVQEKDKSAEIGARMMAKEREESREKKLLMIPAIVLTVLNVSNMIRPWMFSISSDGSCALGVWTFAQSVFPLIYVAVSVFLEKKNPELYQNPLFGERAKTIMVVFISVAAQVQVVLKNVPIFAFAVTLCYLICYIFMHDESISVDALTHLNNRRQFNRYLNTKMHEKRNPNQHLYLMIMDVDFFKHINDKYGHVEGDAALIRVADTMRKCGEAAGRKRMQFSRYGGDEFIIVLETSRPSQVEELKVSLQEVLDEKTKDAGVPYEMKVSIGVAEYNPSMKTVSDFLGVADAALYEVKQEHHSRRANKS